MPAVGPLAQSRQRSGRQVHPDVARQGATGEGAVRFPIPLPTFPCPVLAPKPPAASTSRRTPLGKLAVAEETDDQPGIGMGARECTRPVESWGPWCGSADLASKANKADLFLAAQGYRRVRCAPPDIRRQVVRRALPPTPSGGDEPRQTRGDVAFCSAVRSAELQPAAVWMSLNAPVWPELPAQPGARRPTRCP